MPEHWPAKIIERLGKEPDSVIAAELKCDPQRVAEKREELRIPAMRPKIAWTPERDRIVMTLPIAQAAAELGITPTAVKVRRTRLKQALPPPEPQLEMLDTSLASLAPAPKLAPATTPEPTPPRFIDTLAAIQTKYGKTDTHTVFNRAIRAECPGGSLVLDCLEEWHRTANRVGRLDVNGRKTLAAIAMENLQSIRDAMEDEMRKKYRIPARKAEK